MNIFETMVPDTGYTAQELADLESVSLKEMETELMNQYQSGKIDMLNARGYKFYFLKPRSLD